MRSNYLGFFHCFLNSVYVFENFSLISGYLGDILEDLGHPLTESLKSIVFLLKLSPKEFLTSSSGQPQKLVSAVKEMRSIATQPTSRKN